MEQLIQQLLRRPDLPKLRDRIQRTLDEETAPREAFLRSMTDGDRHEFINGKPHHAEPLTLFHMQMTKAIYRQVDLHAEVQGLGITASTTTMIRLTRNDYHPDVCFWRKEVADGFTRDQTIFPPPDFIAEVLSETTAERDRGVKFIDYAAHGVREYWIVDPPARTIEQYVLEGSEYRLLRKLDGGALRSEVVSGFEIQVADVFAAGS